MKKGFTLIELLAVIAILAIILLIAIPKVISLIDNIKTSAFIKNEEMMIKATKNYLAANQSLIPDTIGQTTEVSLTDLQTSNFITSIKDPSNTSNTCGGYILVTKINSGFDYTPYLKCDPVYNNYTTDKLTVDYKLNTDAQDLTPNNYNGTVYGTTNTTNRFNQPNQALYFDGVDDYINCFNIGTLNVYTATVWINPSTLVGTGDNLTYGFTIMATSINYGIWLLYNNKEIKFYAFSPDISTYGMTTNANVDINTWTQVSVSATLNGEAKIYINGILNTTFTASTQNWAGTLTIGDLRPTRQIYFKGSLDDIKIYNRILSANEILRNYQVEKEVSR